MKDVSIGFVYTEDWTPGEWNGQKYDFIQRDIVINHVAVGVPKGRCPSPLCGLSVDMATITVGADPWEETATSIRSGHGDPSQASDCRTKVINEGLSLIVCKNKDTGAWFDQSWIFHKAQGWTMQKAKEWFAKHTGDSRALIALLAAETAEVDFLKKAKRSSTDSAGELIENSQNLQEAVDALTDSYFTT